MKPSRHELFSTLMHAGGALLLFSGANTHTFIVESVLHSVSTRDPSFDPHAGYIGLMIMYATYTFITLFSPWIVYRIGSSRSLAIGAFCFATYLTSFFVLNNTYYLCGQALAGFSWAMIYAGQGLYIAEHSTRKTLTRNSSIVGAIANAGMIAGGAMLLLIFTFVPVNNPNNQAISTNSSLTPHNQTITTAIATTTLAPHKKEYRYFSNFEIYIIFGACISVVLVAGIIFAFLPRKQHNSIVQNEQVQKPALSRQIKLIFEAFCEPRIILLSFFFTLYGLQVTFMNSVYPTTFAFAKSLSSNHSLIAIYSMCIGLGDVIMGVYITVCSRRWPLFGLAPTMLTQFFVALIMYSLIWMSSPSWSTVMPTDDPAPLIQPSAPLCILIGLLLGISDGSLGPMRMIVCTLVVPEKKLQTYSLSKLYQSLASCIAFYLSSHISMTTWIIILTVAQLCSCTGYLIVSRKLMKDHVKIHSDSPIPVSSKAAIAEATGQVEDD